MQKRVQQSMDHLWRSGLMVKRLAPSISMSDRIWWFWQWDGWGRHAKEPSFHLCGGCKQRQKTYEDRKSAHEWCARNYNYHMTETEQERTSHSFSGGLPEATSDLRLRHFKLGFVEVFGEFPYGFDPMGWNSPLNPQFGENALLFQPPEANQNKRFTNIWLAPRVNSFSRSEANKRSFPSSLDVPQNRKVCLKSWWKKPNWAMKKPSGYCIENYIAQLCGIISKQPLENSLSNSQCTGK